MSRACVKELVIYEASGVTASFYGPYIAIPANLKDWYLLLDVTEAAAGVLISGFYTDEQNVTAAPVSTLNQTFSAISATTKARYFSAAAAQALLGPYGYFRVISLTGTWDISLKMYYSI